MGKCSNLLKPNLDALPQVKQLKGVRAAVRQFTSEFENIYPSQI